MRNLIILLLALPVLAYVGLCGMLYLRQREMIYYPQYTRVEASQTDFSLRRGDVVLRGWAIHPGRSDAVLYFGGNAEPIQNMHGRLSHWFPERSVYLLSYRGYGASDGAPEEALLLDDALALYDEVRARHPDGTVSVIGRSLGSGVASYVASKRPVHRLVLVTPFDSISSVAQGHYPWMPVGLLIKDRFQSDRYLAAYDRPVLVIRAGRDLIVPPANTDRLVAALPTPPTVLTVPGADHRSIFGTAEPGEAIAAFVAR